MKKSRFGEKQIIAMRSEHEGGKKTADVCRKHGIRSPGLPARAATLLEHQDSLAESQP